MSSNREIRPKAPLRTTGAHRHPAISPILIPIYTKALSMSLPCTAAPNARCRHVKLFTFCKGGRAPTRESDTRGKTVSPPLKLCERSERDRAFPQSGKKQRFMWVEYSLTDDQSRDSRHTSENVAVGVQTEGLSGRITRDLQRLSVALRHQRNVTQTTTQLS